MCGELWMRTEERFQGGFTAALSAPGDTETRCIAAARFVVSWCRDHPDEAQVLLAGPDALSAAQWPAELVARHRRLNRELRKTLSAVPADSDRLTAAVVDIPYAVVRRHLLAHRPIPASAEVIVADCARTLLTK